MGWFGPQGDCGCCDGCEDCTSDDITVTGVWTDNNCSSCSALDSVSCFFISSPNDCEHTKSVVACDAGDPFLFEVQRNGTAVRVAISIGAGTFVFRGDAVTDCIDGDIECAFDTEFGNPNGPCTRPSSVFVNYPV